MNPVTVLTDSTAYLPAELQRDLGIQVVPLSVIWEGKTFRDGVDLQPEEFYRRLGETKSMPTTSQVTVGEMSSVFTRLLEGGRDVLGIFLSSRFSGTYDAAVQARRELPGGESRIGLVDSLFTTMAMGWPVLAAARLAKGGAALVACLRTAETARDQSGVLFVVDTLEYLRRGGRIGGAQALLGTALNIKPILEMRAGRIESVEKVRTRGRAFDRMLDLVVERVAGRSPVRIAAVHAAAADEAAVLLEKARQRLTPVETVCCPLSPVIGTHAGPGTVALAYRAGEG